MRLVGFAGTALVVAGLAAFSVQDRSATTPDGVQADALERVANPIAGAATDLIEGAAADPIATVDAVEPLAGAQRSANQAPDPSESRDSDTPDDRAARDDGDDAGEIRARSSNRRFGRRGRRYEEPLPSPEDWEPPEGPVRIALQAGHWRAEEAPRELSGLKGNGTSWGSMHEWEANLAIAKQAGAMLEELGYQVDILPAVVPPEYRAHLFVAIHADGAIDPAATGYRVAAPRRDPTGRAGRMVRLLEDSYGRVTGINRLPTVTRRMQNYYAFNSRRYDHALHPMTIAVIIETGFLTSARDREVIVNDPGRAARGIVEAIAAFPETPPPTPAAATGEREGS